MALEEFCYLLVSKLFEQVRSEATSILVTAGKQFWSFLQNEKTSDI